MRVLKRATPTVRIRFIHKTHLRGPMTLTPVAERLGVELSQPVLAYLS